MATGTGSSSAPLRYLAFYLPQFHPIPENDAWWGVGFTEWTRVRRGTPLFDGHNQPQLPDGTLGFYDLRDPAAREAQAKLARMSGIDGFVYYHYWFGGKQLLERPFDEVLWSGKPAFPFCLCWANESWTRTWDGAGATLIAQRYTEEDDRAHIRWLCKAFADPRYIRVNDKPLLLIYRSSDLPDVRRTTDIWRDEAVRLGLGEIYLCRVEAFLADRGDPISLGFDAGVEFQPDWTRTGPRLRPESDDQGEPGPQPASDVACVTLYSYPIAAELAVTHPPVSYKRYRCVMPGWDNTARRGASGTVFMGSSPARYERWLASIASNFRPFSPDENLVFVNAWNEWGEGAHLEPDTRWGQGYLERHLSGTGR